MTTENVTVRKQMVKVKVGKGALARVAMPRRCKLCGRVRTAYGTFGICRLCWGNMGGDGLIPGVQKAKW